jgi:hypothetical protein
VLEPRHTATAVTTSYTVDMNWHVDSRAIDHIMSELDKLAIQDKYNGTEKVHMVSGSGMEISHTGKSFIHTLSRKLKLCNILHVPKATKNILYIHCFALDNNIFFEIHPWFFQLRISTRGALYLKESVMMACTPLLPHHTSPSFLLELISHPSLGGMSV